ncbi:MAG: SHOCT domain-containing protein [Bacteroidota bacterium]
MKKVNYWGFVFAVIMIICVFLPWAKGIYTISGAVNSNYSSIGISGIHFNFGIVGIIISLVCFFLMFFDRKLRLIGGAMNFFLSIGFLFWMKQAASSNRMGSGDYSFHSTSSVKPEYGLILFLIAAISYFLSNLLFSEKMNSSASLNASENLDNNQDSIISNLSELKESGVIDETIFIQKKEELKEKIISERGSSDIDGLNKLSKLHNYKMIKNEYANLLSLKSNGSLSENEFKEKLEDLVQRVSNEMVERGTNASIFRFDKLKNSGMLTDEEYTKMRKDVRINYKIKVDILMLLQNEMSIIVDNEIFDLTKIEDNSPFLIVEKTL